jgi:hypothetical protein
MGGLKPIGSEKLEGMDKIRRIMEIARYNENIPNPVNENKSNEYSISLADGNTYSIVKEKQGYIIKSTINEGTLDYIEPIRERRYYNSYSQALKRLNLMAKEVNTMNSNNSGTSFFDGEKKKLSEAVYLKVPGVTDDQKQQGSQSAIPSPQPVPQPVPHPVAGTPPQPVGGVPPVPQPAPPAPQPVGGVPPVPQPAPQPVGGVPPAPQPAPQPLGEGGELDEQAPVAAEAPPVPAPAPEGDVPPPPMDDTTMEEPPMDDMDDMADEDSEGSEGSDKKDMVTFKLLQKLTGKLTQKIRKYNEDEEMSSDDTKYIINSVLSALELEVLDEEDIEEIIDRLEGVEDDDFDEDLGDMDDEEMSPPEGGDMGGEVPPPPPVEGGEMAEDFSFDEIDFENFTDDRFDVEEFEFDEPPRRWGARKGKHDSSKHLKHGTWGESVVDRTISKYFLETDNEKINKTKKHIRNLSENIAQERLGLKFVEKHPDSKILGKLTNGNLVFENRNIKYKITPSGEII